jgi:hypothetical protein
MKNAFSSWIILIKSRKITVLSASAPLKRRGIPLFLRKVNQGCEGRHPLRMRKFDWNPNPQPITAK